MIQMPEKQAATKLNSLLHAASEGRDVVILGSDGVAYKLIALNRTPKPVFGSAKGLVEIKPNFDDPVDGFGEYAP